MLYYIRKEGVIGFDLRARGKAACRRVDLALRAYNTTNVNTIPVMAMPMAVTPMAPMMAFLPN